RCGSVPPVTTWKSPTWWPRCARPAAPFTCPGCPCSWTTTPCRWLNWCWARRAPGRTVTMTMSSEGPSPPRVEDPRLLRGRGRFVDNLPIEGALVARFVRSPYAAARIGPVDAREALALDGVVAVFTAA